MRIISHRRDTSAGQHASQDRKRRNKLRRHDELAQEAASLGISIGDLRQRHEQAWQAIIAVEKVRAAANRKFDQERRSYSYGSYW